MFTVTLRNFNNSESVTLTNCSITFKNVYGTEFVTVKNSKASFTFSCGASISFTDRKYNNEKTISLFDSEIRNLIIGK